MTQTPNRVVTQDIDGLSIADIFCSHESFADQLAAKSGFDSGHRRAIRQSTDVSAAVDSLSRLWGQSAAPIGSADWHSALQLLISLAAMEYQIREFYEILGAESEVMAPKKSEAEDDQSPAMSSPRPYSEGSTPRQPCLQSPLETRDTKTIDQRTRGLIKEDE